MALQAWGIRQRNKAAAQAANMKMTGAVQEMNYAFQNYEQERRDSYEAAVNDIIKTRINQMQLNSSVQAAIAEGVAGGGRTADRLIRAGEADTARAVGSIQDNYSRKSNEIDLNKETTALSTKEYIANTYAQAKPDKIGDLMSLAATGLKGYAAKKDATAINNYRRNVNVSPIETTRNALGNDRGWGDYTGYKLKTKRQNDYNFAWEPKYSNSRFRTMNRLREGV